MRMAGKINLTTIYGFYIKNWKTNLLKALYNGRIDISHILKTQEIIPINLTNTTVQSVIMAYSQMILMVMSGEEVEGVVWRNESIISF